MRQNIWTISVTDITDEGFDLYDPLTVLEYESETAAVEAAIKLATNLSDKYPDVFNVSVFAGEYKTETGDVFGEPFDIFTVSSKGWGATWLAREKAGYVFLTVNGYIVNGKYVSYSQLKKEQ